MPRRAPPRIAHLRVFAQVGECYDVTGVGGRSGLVGHPDFHAVDIYAGSHVGQRTHTLSIVIAEILGEEEVAVFFVVGHIDLKGCQLYAALTAHRLSGRLFLREHGLQFQFAKLHVGSQSEERAGSLHERGVAGEGDVAGLYELDDLVLLTVVFQFKVLCVIVKGRVGVVVEVHVHLIAHLAVHVEVDLLVEVHRRRLAVANGERRVVDVFQCGTKLQFGRSLRFDADAAGTEDFLSRPEVKVHVGEVEFLLAFCLVDFRILVLEILLQRPALHPFAIFLGRHHDGRVEVGVADLRADDVSVEGVVVDDILLEVVGTFQVGWILVEIVVGDGSGALDLPAWMEQRVGNLLFVGAHSLALHLDLWLVLGLVVLRLGIIFRTNALTLVLLLLLLAFLLLLAAGEIVLHKRHGKCTGGSQNRHHNHYPSMN